MLSNAQCISIGTNGNEDSWNNFMGGLGLTPPKFADLAEALEKDISKEDIQKQIQAMKHYS